ncbi:hypothetical protein HZB07_06075 [Candidatus Saganbacteria bacterium]|nr:hypothetical protein [Candidatus Saganbacteria bacterium]
MLSEQEKTELLADAKSQKRRDDFRKIKSTLKGLSLDNFINFLRSFQVIFPSITKTKKIITSDNRL